MSNILGTGANGGFTPGFTALSEQARNAMFLLLYGAVLRVGNEVEACLLLVAQSGNRINISNNDFQAFFARIEAILVQISTACSTAPKPDPQKSAIENLRRNMLQVAILEITTLLNSLETRLAIKKELHY